MVRAVRRAAALVLVCVVALTALATCSIEQRGFTIDAIEVDATLRADGVLSVSELVTYTFTGADSDPFTVGTRNWDRPEGTITSIQAYRDGEPLRTLLATPTLFEWDIAPARSGTFTYELRYEVVGAVRVGSDVVELNRQWVGTSSPAVADWSASITVPDGAGEILVWAHGPLDGTIDRDDPLVSARVADVPSGRFVETRTAVPVERFTLPAGSTPILPEILAEEEEWAAEANAERDGVREREQREADGRRALNVLVVPLTAIAGWGFWMIWRRWGKDPARPSDIGDYWREVPDDPPAVAAAFLAWGTVGSDGYSATILDLARRGHLRVEEVVIDRFLRSDTTSHRFVRTTPPASGSLLPYEQRALSWLFRDGPEITQTELVERNRKEQSKAHASWQAFQKGVKSDLDGRRYVVRGKHVAFGLHFLIVAVLGLLAVAAGALGAWIAMAIFGAAAVVLLPLGILHRSRTEAGTRRYAEWTALRRYLKDFSRLDEAPAGHLVLWEQYLVAAVALGVAEELIEGLEVQFPELMEQSSGFAPWYVATSGGHGRMGAMGSFGSDFGSAAISSSTPQSSGSGGGGGFSGGGGGGGGGGGFGAR